MRLLIGPSYLINLTKYKTVREILLGEGKKTPNIKPLEAMSAGLN